MTSMNTPEAAITCESQVEGSVQGRCTDIVLGGRFGSRGGDAERFLRCFERLSVGFDSCSEDAPRMQQAGRGFAGAWGRLCDCRRGTA